MRYMLGDERPGRTGSAALPSMRDIIRGCIGAVAGVLIVAGPAHPAAADGRETAPISRANRVLKAAALPAGSPAPVIDGDLGDAAWKMAARADTFVDPNTSGVFAD